MYRSINALWNASTPTLFNSDVISTSMSSIDAYWCPFIFNLNLKSENSIGMDRSGEYGGWFMYTTCRLAKTCCTSMNFVSRRVVVQEVPISTVSKLSVTCHIRFRNRCNTSLWIEPVPVGGIMLSNAHAGYFSHFDLNMDNLIYPRLRSILFQLASSKTIQIEANNS